MIFGRLLIERAGAPINMLRPHINGAHVRFVFNPTHRWDRTLGDLLNTSRQPKAGGYFASRETRDDALVNPDHGGKRPLRQPFFFEVIMQSRHKEIMRDAHCHVKTMNAQHAFVGGMRAVHNFGMSIKSIRDSRDLSQSDLAEMAGIAQSTVHRAEALAKGTRLEVYLKIAEALEVPLYDLFADERAAVEDAILTAFRSADEVGKGMLMALAQKASSLAVGSPGASNEAGKE